MLNKRDEGSSNRKYWKEKNAFKANLFPCNQEFLTVSSLNSLFFLLTKKEEDLLIKWLEKVKVIDEVQEFCDICDL